jgi:tetratricopeptide (TPR) repeat protein
MQSLPNRNLIIFLSFFLFLLYVPSARGQKPDVTINEKSLAVIYVDKGEGGLIAAGNGFVVDSGGIIATSSHVVSGYSREGSDSLFVRIEGAYYEAEDVISRGDVAFLKVPAEGLPSLPLAGEHILREGEKIIIIGSLSGIKLEYHEGMITGILKDGDLMRTDISISRTLVGSPAIGEGGEVIGLASLSVIGGRNFNLVVPSKFIGNLLEEYKNERRPERTGKTMEGAVEERSVAELEAELEKAKAGVSENPESAGAHVLLAWNYTQLGMYKEAAEEYQEAIKLRPELAETFVNLGVLFGKHLRMYDDAIRTFKKAIEIEPDNPDAHFNLGIAYLIQEDRESAIEEYEILKDIAPEMAGKLYGLLYEYE